MTAPRTDAGEPASGARPRPLVLVVLDGFGVGGDPASDATLAARMPVWHALLARYPHATLAASAEAVGLPVGQMGNSEVGHLNLGAGRPVLQDLPRIDAAIADGTFAERPAFLEACRRASPTLHVVSLVGPGGVHANDRHVVALAELAARQDVGRVRLHALLDGRDTPPSSALEFVADLERRLAAAHPDARIASIGGRYWAMDRDKRWERIERGYDAIVHAEGLHAPSAAEAIQAAYARGETDEFVAPTVIDRAIAPVQDGDPIIHANFRADRARQLSRALALADFDAFDRAAPSGRPAPRDLYVVTMTAYEDGLPVTVAFPADEARSLSEAFSEAGWRQLHVAETEKYAHVTYFFNGGRETPFAGEDRRLIPSPKVATYDLQPEMSAAGITDVLVAAIGAGEYDFIVANFANPDMVGHTGVWDAAVQALEAVDACLGRVVAAMAAADAASPAGALLAVTADHGNVEWMRDEHDAPVTAHSLNPVPLVLVGRSVAGRRLRDGVLADVAPTLLDLVGMDPWPGMTGTSLLEPG